MNYLWLFPQIITREVICIALWFFAVIASIEGGIIFGLKIRAGSLNRLLLLTANNTDNHGEYAENSKKGTTDCPKQ